ncbi:MAG TPA: DUF72 domain-containing protein [Candidatus Acidoferrales bacterium]|nr:DUF72 domain-containing protein [Candidatus Acidoferrales bacterium]
MAEIYAGTSGWSYSSWKPKFYPSKLASAKFLSYYATRLNSVEVNYTFRTLPTEKLLAGWIASTPVHFKFTAKAHQVITHIKRLRDTRKYLLDFLHSLQPLRDEGRLGLILFQLPPNFKCDVARLIEFLDDLPHGIRCAFEFRHETWFCEEVFAALRARNAALCWAESEKLKTPEVRTANFSYLRLRKKKYSAAALKSVISKVGKLAQQGDVFAYFKHEETPEGAVCAVQVLRRARAS